MEYGIFKIWYGKNFPYFHTFSVLGHLNLVFIRSAVNKAAFDQMHKMIKEKSNSQKSIEINSKNNPKLSKTKAGPILQ